MPNKRKASKQLAQIPKAEVILKPPPPVFDGSIDGLARLVKGDLESLPDARRRLVELLRGEEDVKKFVKAADKMFMGKQHIPGKGDSPSLDKVCERSGANRSIIFGAVARVLHRYHFDVAQIVIGAVVANRAHDVASSMAEMAQLPIGAVDRRLFMEVAGAKRAGTGGVSVQVNTSANAQAGANAEVVEPSGRELPSFEAGIRDMAAKLRAIPARTNE